MELNIFPDYVPLLVAFVVVAFTPVKFWREVEALSWRVSRVAGPEVIAEAFKVPIVPTFE